MTQYKLDNVTLHRMEQMQREKPEGGHWLPALFALAALIALLLLQPYRGLHHDARMYTLQALSHLRPELYGHDIFLSMGSQDNYTLFSPFYAWVISLLGIEPAAAVLTLCFLALFLASVYALSRVMLPAEQAWSAFLILVLVPARYGPGEIFNYIESFVTPRQLAEALTVLSLIWWLQGKRVTAALFAAGAMSIHPIIGLAGPTLIVTMEYVIPRWRKLLPIASFALLLGGLAIAGSLPIERWRFDDEWYDIVANRRYLFLTNWETGDWGRVIAVFTTLAIGATSLREPLQRKVATAGLVSCAGLLVVALVGGDLLRIILVVQAQLWRALWLATLLALVLVPPIFLQLWHRSLWSRSTLLLLAAAWVANDSSAVGLAGLALLTSLPGVESRLAPYARSVVAGSWAGLGLAICLNLADARLYLAADLSNLRDAPVFLDRLIGVSRDGTVPGIVMGSFLLAASKLRSSQVRPALAAVASVVAIVLVISTSKSWTAERYSGQVHEAFSEWRERIPVGSEVLWLLADERIEEPATNTWLLLERPSFVSGTQAPNALFSRDAAIEMRNRARSLHGLLPILDPFLPRDKQPPEPDAPLLLNPVCRATKVRFIVTTRNLVDAVPIPAPQSVRPSLRHHKLYICP